MVRINYRRSESPVLNPFEKSISGRVRNFMVRNGSLVESTKFRTNRWITIECSGYERTVSVKSYNGSGTK